jgi:4'-phosphopantetheinyl transferase
LRDLLGRYLGAQPCDIRFEYNPFGKPGLDPAFGSRLRFNLSHSGHLALIAFAAGAEIGIDLEEIRAQPDFTEIARQFFSAAEIEGLNRVPSSLQSRAFLGCWTKKEAFVKACGQGLTMSMRDFSVPLTTDPGEPPADLFVSSTENLPGRRWSIHTLHPATGYIGAIAVEGRGLRLRHCHWQVTRERVTSGGGLELVSG